jgi:hypothetical protein
MRAPAMIDSPLDSKRLPCVPALAAQHLVQFPDEAAMGCEVRADYLLFLRNY